MDVIIGWKVVMMREFYKKTRAGTLEWIDY
jgi:hypothetical protein